MNGHFQTVDWLNTDFEDTEEDTDLPDKHGRQDVQEQERTVGVIVTHQVPVGYPLEPRYWHEREFGNDTSIKAVTEGIWREETTR
jgi:hypothetical protein